MGDNILDSIRYAIDKYKFERHTVPDKILINYTCFMELVSVLGIERTKNKTILCGIPVTIRYECEDEEKPRFWLCQEGTIYD